MYRIDSWTILEDCYMKKQCHKSVCLMLRLVDHDDVALELPISIHGCKNEKGSIEKIFKDIISALEGKELKNDAMKSKKDSENPHGYIG